MNQTAVRACQRRGHERESCKLAHRVDPSQATHRRRFSVAFDAYELSRKENRITGFQLKRLCEQPWRIDERIAMEAAISQKFGLF